MYKIFLYLEIYCIKALLRKGILCQPYTVLEYNSFKDRGILCALQIVCIGRLVNMFDKAVKAWR